jgi:hypothetical protein
LTIWKKAVSALVTAGLLASMTASAAFATKGLTGESDQTDALECIAAAVATEATCATVADGISTVTLGGDSTLVTTGNSLFISATGATIIAAAGGDFVLAGGTVSTGLAPALTNADTITLRAPAAVGSGVVSVYTINASTGIATLEGTLTITFTATSGLNVSEANSTVKLVADTTCVDQTVAKSAAPAVLPSAAQAGLCLVLKDGNGSLLSAAAATVAVTITPIGLVSNGTVTGQSVSLANAAGGVANFTIWNSGLSGVATIGIAVTQGSTTTTFAPRTFTFSGALATLTLSNKGYIGAITNTDGVASTVELRFVGADSAANAVGVDIDNAGPPFDGITVSASAPFTVTSTTDYAGGTTKGTIIVTCGATVGSGTVTLKSGTITSNTVTVACSEPTPDSITAAFDKTAVVPGGSATFTATLKDDNGLLVPDGIAVAVLTSSGVTFDPVEGDFSVKTLNGKSVFTYLAAFNTGVATVTAFNADAGSAMASINVGAVVTVGSARSALGVTTSGPFSLTTKVPALNKYVTVKLSFGTGAAGQTVGILIASKNSAGVWSAFTRRTGRIANSNGDVYFYWRSSSAAWLSIRGSLGSVFSNAVQARWR